MSENESDFSQLAKLFAELPVGDLMELPLALLHPIIPNDWLQSHSVGPLEVYLSSNSGQILIDDGNHRYYDILRKLMVTNDFEAVDPSTLVDVMVLVRKVIPEIEW